MARIAVQEFPYRLHDLGEDVKDLFRPAAVRLPPARLRRRVSQTSDREDFSRVGAAAAADIAASFDRSRESGRAYPRWLDFGCGPGRVARHLLTYPPVEELLGLDVDQAAIRWATAHLRPARFRAIQASPPTGLPPGSFDVVFAVSVFTHLNEEAQWSWLSHLSKLLAPGGLLIASTHSPELTYTLPTLSPNELATLAREDFLFVSAGAAFNEDAAFHSLAYLDRAWTRWFTRIDFVPYGLGKHQDLSVWRVREDRR
jgi:SAM-dependent methyltransferase